MTEADDAMLLHASAVALGGRAALILGASGAGKSTLALAMMAMGAGLVADDRVCLRRTDDGLWVSAPPQLPAMIEAWGVGLLAAELTGPARLALVVDLDVEEAERLPPRRTRNLLGLPVPVIFRPPGPGFAAAVLHYLKQGRSA